MSDCSLDTEQEGLGPISGARRNSVLLSISLADFVQILRLENENVEQIARELGFATLAREDRMILCDFGTYSQCSDPICSRSETVSDATSGVAIEDVRLDISVTFGDSMSNRC